MYGRTFAVLTALLLAGCQMGPYPSRFVEIQSPASADDLRRFEVVAIDVGFVKVPPPAEPIKQGNQTWKVVESWSLSSNPDTFLAVLFEGEQNRYKLWYGDPSIDGWNFVGPSCVHYLEFVVALKKEFREDSSRLNIHRDTCAANQKSK